MNEIRAAWCLGWALAWLRPPASSAAASRELTVVLSDCSAAGLVEVIRDVNAAGPGPHRVTLKAGFTYTLTAPDNYSCGANGLPPIASDITIEGHGAVIARDPKKPGFRLFCL